MAVDVPKTRYTGTIRQVTIGGPEKAVIVGGEGCFPFYLFEGEMKRLPKVAFEVWDHRPDDWPPWAVEPYADVLGDPAHWARKCVEAYGAEMVALQLKSADPNGMDRDVEEVMAVLKEVLAAIDVPLVVWGTSSDDKDALLLRRAAEVCEGRNVALGPVSEKNYKQIGATAIAYGHVVVGSSPIDVNLAKQLNILLGNLGVRDEKILIDPTTGGLGYGLEYTYSVIERDRMAALTQEDVKLQYPVLCNIGPEVWKAKELRITPEEDPKLGDPRVRSILMESVTAMSLVLAGADIVVVRHPESARYIKEMIAELGQDG